MSPRSHPSSHGAAPHAARLRTNEAMPRVRLTIAAGVAVLVLLVVAIWFAVLSPRLAEAGRLQQQAVDLETANLGLLNTFNRSMELARQAPEAAAEAQRLFDAMPQQADLPRVLEQVTQAATDAGIDPGAIQTITTTIPAAVAEGGEGNAGIALAQLQISITAQGTQPQVLEFLDNVQKLDRILLVTSSRLAEVTAQNTRNQWTMQVTGTMFVLQSELPDLVAEVEGLMEPGSLSSREP